MNNKNYNKFYCFSNNLKITNKIKKMEKPKTKKKRIQKDQKLSFGLALKNNVYINNIILQSFID